MKRLCLIGAPWCSGSFGGMGRITRGKAKDQAGRKGTADSRDRQQHMAALKRRAGRNWRSRKRSWDGF